MDALLQNKTAMELGKLLSDHRGGEVIVMDMRPLEFWTDYFIIATVTSNTHMSGLERHLKDYFRDNDLEILYRSSRPGGSGRSGRTGGTGWLKSNIERTFSEQGAESGTELYPNDWSLLDLGGIVIHLMTSRSRTFYELERLWSNAPIIFRGEDQVSEEA